jgi:hypothetical protein
MAVTPRQPEASLIGVIRQRNVCPSSRRENGELFCEWNVEHSGRLRTAAPAGDNFIEQHERTARKAGEAMSLPFLGRCALVAMIALSPIAAALSQSASDGPAISANDLVRAVVANELKAQDEGHSRRMYRVDREEQNKKKAKEVVQTGQGSLGRLGAVDGQAEDLLECSHESETSNSLCR